MENKLALITGVRGQDGSWLTKLLLEKNYNVIGIDRRSGNGEKYNWRHKELGIDGKFKIDYCDISEFHNVCEIIEKYKPDEVYNLAAESFVQTSFQQPFHVLDVNGKGQLNFLEAIRKYSPNTKIYFAGSSEQYGKVQEIPQTEKTIFYPRSPYACAKVFGYDITRNYREAYGLFACSGILFNHTGILRGEEFVTRKITQNMARWYLNKITSFELGNIDSLRDFGSAEDYVEMMYKMLQQNIADDFVISSNETHSIREIIQICFEYLDIKEEYKYSGIDTQIWAKGMPVITMNKEFFRPTEVDLLLGCSEKAKNVIGWQPKTSFRDLIRGMLEKDLEREFER